MDSTGAVASGVNADVLIRFVREGGTEVDTLNLALNQGAGTAVGLVHTSGEYRVVATALVQDSRLSATTSVFSVSPPPLLLGAQATTADSGRTVMIGPAVVSVDSGAIIVDPQGRFIRVVDKVEKQAGATKLTTRPASLNQLVKNGSLKNTTSVGGRATLAADTLRQVAFPLDANLALEELRLQEYDEKKNVIGQAKAGAAIDFSGQASVDFEFEGFRTRRFSMALEGDLFARGSLDISLKKGFDRDTTITRSLFKKTTLMAIGDWPVLVTYEARVEITPSIHGGAGLDLKFKPEFGRHIRVQVDWDSLGWKESHGAVPIGTNATPNVLGVTSSPIDIGAGLQARLVGSLTLYDLAQVYVFAGVDMKADAQVDLPQFAAVLACSTSANIGVGTGVSRDVEKAAQALPLPVEIPTLELAFSFPDAQSCAATADLAPTKGIRVSGVSPLTAGTTATFTAQPIVVLGIDSLLVDRPITWSSSAASIARVSDNGVVTALSEGKAYVRAANGTAADSVLLTVTKALDLTIDGRILDPNGEPVAFVDIIIPGASANPRTGADGRYLTTVPRGFTGTATPSKADCTFSPPVRQYASLPASESGEDYIAQCPVVQPEASGFILRGPPASGGAGDSVDVTLVGRNSGKAATNEGVFTVSFPALTLPADSARFRVLSAPSGMVVSRFAATKPLKTISGESKTSAYLTIEGRVALWAAGKTDSLRLRVATRDTGVFGILGRFALNVKPNVYSRAPSTGLLKDQQNGFVDTLAIRVRANQPVASGLTIKPSASTVAAGKSVDLTIVGRNVGAPSSSGYLSVSFPSLTSPGDTSRIGILSRTEGMAVSKYGQGQQITNVSGATMTAQYVLVDGLDQAWTPDKADTIVLRVTPPAAGTFTAYAREALQVSGTNYSRDPVSGTEKDQQGAYVAKVTITVTATPAVASGLAMSVPAQAYVGEPFEVVISGANTGGASNDGYLSVSFPAFTAASDTSRVQGAAKTASMVVNKYGAGRSIFDVDGAPMTASYLLVDGEDKPWDAGKTDTMRLTVTPSAPGKFVVQAREALLATGTSYSRDPSAGTTKDQQRALVRVETVTVVARQPKASGLSVSTSKASIVIGEAFDVTVIGKNTGTGSSPDGYLSVSFPKLTLANQAQAVQVTSSTGVDVYPYPKGTEIFKVDGTTKINSQYLLVDAEDKSWAAGESHTVKFRVTPPDTGTFRIYAREALLISGNEWSRDPGSSNDKDQQDGYVAVATVTVRPNEPIASSLAITASRSSIVLGESFDVTIVGSNVGPKASADGYLSVSFPSLSLAADTSRVQKLLASTGMEVQKYGAGRDIYDVFNQQIKAGYLLVDGQDADWPAGATDTLKLRVTPKATGSFKVYAREALFVEGTRYSRDPGTGTTQDQQKGVVRAVEVTVRAVAPPPPD